VRRTALSKDFMITRHLRPHTPGTSSRVLQALILLLCVLFVPSGMPAQEMTQPVTSPAQSIQPAPQPAADAPPNPMPLAVSPQAATPDEDPMLPRSKRGADEQPTLDPLRFTITIHSPYQSLSKVRQLLNEIAIDLITQLGYVESIPKEGESKTARTTGVAEQRFFLKKLTSQSGRRSVELDVVQNASGTYDIILYGVTREGTSETPNPDLPRFLPTVVMLFNEAEEAGRQQGHGPLGHFLFQLSYIQADQAMGMLKALGYSTVEFSKQGGASIWESLYEPVKRGEAHLPVVIKFIEGSKMSLMEPAEGALPPMMSPQQRGAIPDIGGTFLHHMTTGEPEQRLLIVYDQEQPDAMELLLNMLRETIDVAARQVVISALVVEINSNKSKDLGLTFTGGNGRNTAGFSRDASNTQLPFTYTFDSSVPSRAFTFSATLSALIQSGEAEILSNPSVLVLDGRQARIQIGKQVPVVNSTATAAGITSSVEYFPVGIVLNLRPRINQQGSEVTMQVETIVSAIGTNATASSAVLFAPTIDNRQVQTFVRVADNTPFIIGGLISSDKSTQRSGIPLLSQIPHIGAFFRKTSKTRTKKEVIVVLTPHIIPPDHPSFSYVIPKDSDLFDSSGQQLFRNAYRIRAEDVHDLRFVDDSEVFQALLARVRSRAQIRPSMRSAEPFASLLAGRIPGEEILVHRMLWEIIERSGVVRDVDPQRVTLFEGSTNLADSDLKVGQLSTNLARLDADKNAMIMTFQSVVGTSEHPFAQPKAAVTYEHIAPGGADQLLLERNTRKEDGRPDQWSIVVSPDNYGGVTPLDALRGVLVLKKLLVLNTGTPLTLTNFHVGRQIIFPTEQDLQQSLHVVDRETAQLFYEVVEYYQAFEDEFNRKTHEAFRAMALEKN
jgi:general secretion pathway protein D